MSHQALLVGYCVLLAFSVNQIHSKEIHKMTSLTNLRHVTYRPGNCNIIVAAPHGGGRVLEGAPVRQVGCYDGHKCDYAYNCTDNNTHSPRSKRKCKANIFMDLHTREIAQLIGEKFAEKTGKRLHIVLLDVHRRYVDANRARDPGTGKSPAAVEAWDEFHNVIKTLRGSFEGPAIYFDIHGQKHPHGLIELGYRIRGSKYNTLDFSAADTSIRNLACRSKIGTKLEDLMWGEKSFGALLQQNSYSSVPSPKYPKPGDLKYYIGGYNTEEYGSKNGGEMDAIQIELPAWVRNTENATGIAIAVANSISQYTDMHYTT